MTNITEFVVYILGGIMILFTLYLVMWVLYFCFSFVTKIMSDFIGFFK